MSSVSVKQQLRDIEQSLLKSLLKDRHIIRRKINTIRGRIKDNKPIDQLLNKLLQDFEQSSQALQQRHSTLPTFDYPEELPVSQKRAEIIEAIKNHQVIVICGETGSGKTTQLPKMCLDAGYGIAGMIGHTQPRRLAARSVASRIADEMKTELGKTVGFKIRFTDQLSSNSLIKLMTDGILLSEIHHDPYLNQYDCIIVDEAHERSLNIDFLLGYLKRLIVKRKDLKIIITSATIDPDRFARHFNQAPVIEVSGRTFPVEVEYRPCELDNKQVDLQRAIADCVEEISRIDRGDILVFLSGERDIRESADYLSKQNYQNTEVLPLLARLSASEQNKIFKSSGKQRIILSTNVAETSLTVPGIKYVIDTGLARISRYSWRSKIQRLPIEKISQASANQRKGRCGRVSAGVCFRLYSEEDFSLRTEFTEPEIQRTNLAAVILQMEHMQLGHIEDFPFVEPPDSRLINDGYKLLHELGAIDNKNKITPIGKKLARLPIDPKLGRILIESSQENCMHECLIIVSALAVQDPRERPLEKQQAADEAHKTFSDNRSDFISWLNIWNKFHQQKENLSSNKLRKWCKDHFISWLRMREWIDTHKQIGKMLNELNFKKQSSQHTYDADQEINYDSIHRSILTGLLSNIGFKDEGHEYQACRQRKFLIFPGSGLFNRGPKWIMASEIVETQKVYGRNLAKIDPLWINQKAQHLIKHSYQQAHWSKKAAQVNATRKSTLFGLLVDPGKPINYGPVNPTESREIFIRSALVDGDFNCSHHFFKHNRDLIEQVETLEAKSRRQDILVDEQVLFDFYDQHLPDDIYSGPQLNAWVKKNDESRLLLSIDDLIQQQSHQVSSELFPDTLTINNIAFPLEYHFDPNHHCDGITLITPVAGLASIDTQRCEWLVPGMLEEKMTELIRSLPKQLRRNFVPAPDFARACLEALQVDNISLTGAMEKQLKRISGIDIPYDAWQIDRLDSYLFFNFRVISSDGKTLKESRDLSSLVDFFSDYKDTSPVDNKPHALEQDNVDSSILETLPDHIEINNHGITVKAYPALSYQKKQVNTRIFNSQTEARQEHFLALRQLFLQSLSQTIRHLKSSMPDIQTLCIHYASLGNCEQLRTHLIYRTVDQLFTRHLPATHQQYQAILDKNRSEVDTVLKHNIRLTKDILATFNRLQKQLKNPPLHWLDAMTDIQDQLNHLLPADFVLNVAESNYNDLIRYLKAIDKRLEKIQDNPDRDRKSRLEISSLWNEYKKRAEQLKSQNRHSVQLDDYRWLLEEYRISLFAQEIKTKAPVSAKRLKNAWNDISDI